MSFKKNKKINIEIIIDDLFQIIPTKEPFTIEPLLAKVLQNRKLFEGKEIFFVAGADKVETILLSNDLAVEASANSLRLTEKGILAKEVGGLIAYRKYRRELLGFNTHQRKINRWLIAATFLAGLSPIIVELIKTYWISNEPVSIKVTNPIYISDTLKAKTDTLNLTQRNDSITLPKE